MWLSGGLADIDSLPSASLRFSHTTTEEGDGACGRQGPLRPLNCGPMERYRAAMHSLALAYFWPS